MTKWKDVSSFSRDDKVRTPNAFELSAKGIRITVHRWMHADDKLEWYFSCYEIGAPTVACGTRDLEEAKLRALTTVKARLREWLAGLE